MNEKKIIKLAGKVARAIIDLVQEELTGEKRKKKKEKPNGSRKKVSSVDRSSNRSR